tara:strand:- start:279 stop:431 length:153 start_codon:yes stop_codon:yes gene_type:complete
MEKGCLRAALFLFAGFGEICKMSGFADVRTAPGEFKIKAERFQIVSPGVD